MKKITPPSPLEKEKALWKGKHDKRPFSEWSKEEKELHARVISDNIDEEFLEDISHMTPEEIEKGAKEFEELYQSAKESHEREKQKFSYRIGRSIGKIFGR